MWYHSKYVMKEINTQEAEKIIATGSATPIDVRTDDEYNEGHIKGCLHIDIASPDFLSRIAALTKDQAYLIYCAAGGRSSRATQMMTQAGFTNATNLVGGFTGWRKAGLPEEK